MPTKAVEYVLNRGNGFRVSLNTGLIDMDIIQLKMPSILMCDKKNLLFPVSEACAEANAIFLIIVETAELALMISDF